MSTTINQILDKDISGFTKNPKNMKVKSDTSKRLVSLDYRGIYIYVPFNASKSEIEALKSKKIQYWKKVHGDDIERSRIEGKDDRIEFPKPKELDQGEVLRIEKPKDLSFPMFREKVKKYLGHYFDSKYKITYPEKEVATIVRKAKS